MIPINPYTSVETMVRPSCSHKASHTEHASYISIWSVLRSRISFTWERSGMWRLILRGGALQAARLWEARASWGRRSRWRFWCWGGYGRLGVDSWIRFHLMGTMLSLEGLVGYYRGPHGYQASEDSQYAEFDH